MRENMLEAINQMKLVNVTFNSFEKGQITRLCVPFDIGISKRANDGKERYHFYTLNSPDGKHNLSILPSQIINLEVTTESFNPCQYVTWSPTNWFIPRNWGAYS